MNKVATGLPASDGSMLFVGDSVRIPCIDENGPHGAWCEYTIDAKGIIPFVVYKISSTGQVFPVGGTSCPLTHFYDPKEIAGLSDLSECLPVEKISKVID
jgi:hypothetical protein